MTIVFKKNILQMLEDLKFRGTVPSAADSSRRINGTEEEDRIIIDCGYLAVKDVSETKRPRL